MLTKLKLNWNLVGVQNLVTWRIRTDVWNEIGETLLTEIPYRFEIRNQLRKCVDNAY